MSQKKKTTVKGPKFRYLHENPTPQPTGQWEFDYANADMGTSHSLAVSGEERAGYIFICLDNDGFSLKADAVDALIAALKKALAIAQGKRKASKP